MPAPPLSSVVRPVFSVVLISEALTSVFCHLSSAIRHPVFPSILDDSFQQKLADRMWALTKPGGGILWYDFIYNNPRNPDVRGVPLTYAN